MRLLRIPFLAGLLGLGLLWGGTQTALAQRIVINFDDLVLDQESYYNGSDGAGGFVSGGAFFNNDYHDYGDFYTWNGWSYSNVTDVMHGGVQNQYSAYNLPNGGGFLAPNYGVAYNFQLGDAVINLPAGTSPRSVRITNTTYAALSMLYGDQFAKKFGGDDGTDPDWFLLTIYGLDAEGNVTGEVDFYLADYRYEYKYIINQWTKVDLEPLGAATTLVFNLSSTDNGTFGMNTPAYFAIDNLVVK
jgi:hypothetical protein